MPDEVKRYTVIDDSDCEGNLWSNDFGRELEGHTWTFVLAAAYDALKAERDKLAAELAEVRATVSEWACETCRYVYPGPPQAGFKCVVCPRCGGSTMPHELLRTREAEAERDALRAALERNVSEHFCLRCETILRCMVKA